MAPAGAEDNAGAQMVTDPIRPTDDAARAMARDVLAGAGFAALGVLDGEGFPSVTRIALGQDAAGVPLALISDLSAHARALAADRRASLLVGEPGTKGDPLTHPRLTLQVMAEPAAPEERDALAGLWLERHPKAAVYIGFADFRFMRFRVRAGFLNGGFGKAFRMTAGDLGLD